MKIPAQSPAVDNLIAKFKAVTVKFTDRKMTFCNIGTPPEPVVTRGHVLQNLLAVQKIVEKFNGDGIFVAQAKESVVRVGFVDQLINIYKYFSFPCLTAQIKSTSTTIRDAYKMLQSPDFAVFKQSIRCKGCFENNEARQF